MKSDLGELIAKARDAYRDHLLMYGLNSWKGASEASLALSAVDLCGVLMRSKVYRIELGRWVKQEANCESCYTIGETLLKELRDEHTEQGQTFNKFQT